MKGDETIQVLRTRRSVRKFKTSPVDEATLREILDCARLAPTAMNVQPWEFVIVREAARRAELAEITNYGKFIAVAPVCVAVLAREGKYYLEDGCAALVTILIAAWARGLATCWVAGDKKPYADQIRDLLGAPPDQRLVGLIALGHPAETPATPPKRPLDETLHWDTF